MFSVPPEPTRRISIGIRQIIYAKDLVASGNQFINNM